METPVEPAAEGGGAWRLMTDPLWEPAVDGDPPPIEAVVGVWPVDQDGEPGLFRANPLYRPADDDSPSDPVDLFARRVADGQAEPEQVPLLLRECLFDVATNGDGGTLIVDSGDGRRCVAVATAEVHRLRVAAPGWERMDLMDLVDLLADDVDVLINPAAKAELCLPAEQVRAAALLTDDEVDDAYERLIEASHTAAEDGFS